MNIASKYYTLDWVVEVKDHNRPVWEPMAAFNLDEVAYDYASHCFDKAGQHYAYRVVHRYGKRSESWMVKRTYGA